MASGNATDSICPKGWGLPNIDGNKSFTNLIPITYGLTGSDAVSAAKLLAAPLNFVYAGFYSWNTGRDNVRGSHGYWWSTTTYSTTHAYRLFTSSIPTTIYNADYKGHGNSIRCVAR